MFLVDAVSHTETFPYTNANYTNLPLKNFTANDFLAGKVPLADNYFLFNDVVSGPKITLSANSDNTGIVNPVITGTTLTLTPNMTGTATKRLLIRVLGSELAPLGVPSVLQDAYIQVFDSNQTLIAINNTWNVQ